MQKQKLKQKNNDEKKGESRRLGGGWVCVYVCVCVFGRVKEKSTRATLQASKGNEQACEDDGTGWWPLTGRETTKERPGVGLISTLGTYRSSPVPAVGRDPEVHFISTER